MKRISGAICLLLTLLLCLAGCEYFAPKHEHEFSPSYDETSHFQKCPCGEITDKAEHSLEWVIDKKPTHRVTGLKHAECSACGYIADENTVIETTRNEDGTMKIDNELLAILLDHVHTTYGGFSDAASYSLEDIINLSRGIEYFPGDIFNPLLAEFDASDSYYICAYFSHEHEDDFIELMCCCCSESYIWVGFDTKEEIPEIYSGEKLLFAIQMTPSVSCKNLRTDETDIATEHYMIYEPEFENGFNVAPVTEFNSILFYLAYDKGDTVYFSTDPYSYLRLNLRCIEIDGEIYLFKSTSIRTEKSNGEIEVHDLTHTFGQYYDQLMAIMISDLYSETYENASENLTNYYGLFKLEDFVKVLQDDKEKS